MLRIPKNNSQVESSTLPHVYRVVVVVMVLWRVQVDARSFKNHGCFGHAWHLTTWMTKEVAVHSTSMIGSRSVERNSRATFQTSSVEPNSLKGTHGLFEKPPVHRSANSLVGASSQIMSFTSFMNRV